MRVLLMLARAKNDEIKLVVDLSSKLSQRRFLKCLSAGEHRLAFEVIKKFAKVVEYVPEDRSPTLTPDLIIREPRD